MIDLDVLQQGIDFQVFESSDQTDIIFLAFYVAVVSLVVFVVRFFGQSLVHLIHSFRSAVTVTSERPAERHQSIAPATIVTIIVALTLIATITTFFVSEHKYVTQSQDEKSRALDTIESSIADTYVVDTIDVFGDGEDEDVYQRHIGYNTDNVTAAIVNDNPSDLPLVTVNVDETVATYPVSFNNETGDVELHSRTETDDSQPDPDTLLRDNQE